MAHFDDVTLNDAPHSRACGTTPHPHGTMCSTNCPTCHGKVTLTPTSQTEYHPNWGSPLPVNPPRFEEEDPSAPNLYAYEHITKERYDKLIEERYENLHNKLMSASSKSGGPSIALLGTELELLEMVRAHLFGKPKHRDEGITQRETNLVEEMQRARFGGLTKQQLDADHTPIPAMRRESAFYAKCDICDRMAQKINGSWFHAFPSDNQKNQK